MRSIACSKEALSYTQMKYDYLIVGAGLFGSVFAQHATEAGKTCLVIDKNDYVGGNCHTSEIEGIHVHVHGPHMFHCSDSRTWSYMNRWTTFNNFINRPKVNFCGRIFSFPINLMTLTQLWGVNTPTEARKKLDDVKIACDSPRNLEEWVLSQVGNEIYEIFIKGYTEKQ
jgi:UDP-galactopyranose mutase